MCKGWIIASEQHKEDFFSVQVLASRFLNKTYIEFLDFCRDLGADFIITRDDKNEFVYPYFKQVQTAAKLIKLLNKTVLIIENYKNNPVDYIEVKDKIKKVRIRKEN